MLIYVQARSKSPAVHIFPSYPVHHPYSDYPSQHYDSNYSNQVTLLTEEHIPSAQDSYKNAWDPWDQYETKAEDLSAHAVASPSQNNDYCNTQSNVDNISKPFESHNTNAHCVDTQNLSSTTEYRNESPSRQSNTDNQFNPFHTNHTTHDSISVHQTAFQSSCDYSLKVDKNFHTNSPTPLDSPEVYNTPCNIQNLALPHEFEPPCIVASESTIHLNDTEANSSNEDVSTQVVLSNSSCLDIHNSC